MIEPILGPNCTNSLRGREYLPLPKDIHWYVRPGSNVTAQMTECCRNHPPQIAEGCIEWCQVDDRQALINLETCLDHNNGTTTGPSGSDLDFPNAAPARGTMMGVMGLGVWALLMSGLLGTF